MRPSSASSSAAPLPPYQASRLGAALVTLSSLLWLAQAAVIAMAVQAMLNGAPAADAWLPALAVALLGGLRALGEWAGQRLLFVRARAYVGQLRAQAVAALAARSPLDTSRAPSGLAASVLAEQAEAVLPYLLRYLPVQQRVGTVPLVIAAVVAWQSWVCALVLVLAAPLIPLFMALVGWRAKAASEAQLVEMGGMNAFLLDRLRGLTTLRALEAVDATALRLRDSALSLKQRTMRVLRIAFLSSAVLELFAALGVALVAVYIGFHLLGYLNFGAWGGKLSLGQGLFVLLLAPAFFEPLRDLAGVWHDRAAGQAALQALQALSERGSPLPGGAGEAGGEQAPQARTAPTIQLRGACLQHAGTDTPALQDLSLDIGAGEHVALWGPSGSGKSSLLAALAGVLPLQAGSLALDGHLLAEADWPAARRRMGWIAQKPHVFAATVQANVALGRPGLDRAAVDAALATAQLGGVAQAHAASELGEGGTGLSGGELVRLALARVAADPAITLVLADEPTAHLDRQTAAEVAQALRRLAQGRTLVVATHDAALAALMDRRIDLAPAQASAQPAAAAAVDGGVA